MKEIKVMFSRENKLCFCLLYLCLLLNFSCKNKKEYSTQELKAIRDNCMFISKQTVGDDFYYSIYNQANDTIQSWIDNKIKYYARKIIDNWQLDSLVCFNSKKDKCIMLLETQAVDGEMDYIEYLYGIKIKGQWYFISGETMCLPREYYQEDIYTPLSFNKIEELAVKHIFRGYLKKNPLRKGQPGVEKYVINESFFFGFTSAAWSVNWQTNTQEQWDEVYLNLVNNKWKKRDSTDWDAYLNKVNNNRR